MSRDRLAWNAQVTQIELTISLSVKSLQLIEWPASHLRYTGKGNALMPSEPPWAVTKDSAPVPLYKWHRSRNLSLGSPWFRGRTMAMVGLRGTECLIQIAMSSNSCQMLELPSHFDGMRADYCSTVDPFMGCIYWDSPSLKGFLITFNYWIKAFEIAR